MSEKIYITISNNIQNPDDIRGCCYSEENAKALVKEDTDDIITYPIEDSKMDEFDGDILSACTCKYYSPKLKAIVIMIHALYEMDGCSCGGLCHIVTDDDNYDDNNLYTILYECREEKNQDKIEVELVEAICKALLKLSIQERALVFSGFYSSCLCDMDNKCDDCCIEKGKLV